ncbi:hypothetical protein V1264_017449 [Littorina saxatilis]|uniref:Uncharacterized protein n=1 Tax=Littorina saxatilis TaxID=31220 RepID=A0AAN9BJ75_9CAEN
MRTVIDVYTNANELSGYRCTAQADTSGKMATELGKEVNLITTDGYTEVNKREMYLYLLLFFSKSASNSVTDQQLTLTDFSEGIRQETVAPCSKTLFHFCTILRPRFIFTFCRQHFLLDDLPVFRACDWKIAVRRDTGLK